MAESWRDVTPAWGAHIGETSDAWPYHTASWGSLTAEVFGGLFHVLRDPGRGWYVPILLGGKLAAGGFASGPIGYGGVLTADATPLSPDVQLATMAEIEDHLGLPCTRLATTPGTPDDTAVGVARQTVLVDLTGTAEERWDAYPGSVRTAIRKCAHQGLATRTLTLPDAPAAVRLIRDTQLRVRASYQVSERLIERLAGDPSGFAVLVGCYQDGRLLSVGVFLRAFGRVAYLFNGWDAEHSALGANYLMLHTAIETFARRGDQLMDLGYSHQPGLRAFKARWNGRPAALTVVERPVSPVGAGTQGV